MDDGLSFESWSNRDMTFYQERLQSFKDWPKQLIPDKFSLAKAGFYYTGEQDKVQCFACSVKITRWERTDDPWLEHKQELSHDSIARLNCALPITKTISVIR